MKDHIRHINISSLLLICFLLLLLSKTIATNVDRISTTISKQKDLISFFAKLQSGKSVIKITSKKKKTNQKWMQCEKKFLNEKKV